MGKVNYLPHLKDSMPVDVVMYQISFYTVALEAWRRGLKVKYFNSKRGGRIPSTSITYTISDGVDEYHFVCARGTKTTKEAISKAENKNLAYEYLKEKGLPVPESKTFNYGDSSIEEMCEYGESIGYPLVIKPTSMGGGRGVVTNIKSKKDLIESLENVRNEFDVERIIIEKYFENGVDYRFYVLGDKVLSAKKNYPSNVLGDGEKSIEQLIKERNIEIKNNPAIKNRSIKLDKEMLEHLEKKNKSPDYIPEKEERVILREHGKHLGKRLSVECTDTIDPKFLQYAVDALDSIPGLPTGSIDMIINEDTNEGIVNEINTKGEISTHMFPMEGQAIDIPKHLIDFYFPDSQKINDNFYFEFKHVKELFLSGYADEITIPMYPKKTQYKNELVIEGEHLGPLYLKRLKKKAANLHLKGSISPFSREKVKISAIGKQNDLKTFETFINNSSRNRTKVHNVSSSKVQKFDGISSNVFEINDEKLYKKEMKVNTQENRMEEKNKALTEEIRNMRDSYSQKLNEKEDRIQELLEELQGMQESSSWKVTKPLRNVKSKLNR